MQPIVLGIWRHVKNLNTEHRCFGNANVARAEYKLCLVLVVVTTVTSMHYVTDTLSSLCHCVMYFASLLYIPCTLYINMVKMQDNAQECQRERGQQEQADTMIAAVPTTVYYHSIRFTYLLCFSQNNHNFATSWNQRQKDTWTIHRKADAKAPTLTHPLIF